MNERVEISKKLLMVNSASSLVTRIISISVLVWLQQYLLKRITAEEYSLLPVLYSIMMFAPLITTILTGGLGRYIVEAYAKNDDKRVTQIVSTMFPILCATGFVFLVGGWVFAWHIDKVLTIAPESLWDARIMMALLMFSAAIRLPLSPFGVGLFVRQKFVLQNLIGVGIEIFRLSLLFFLLFGISTRILWVVVAAVCAEIVSLTILMIVSQRLVPTLRFRPSHIHWPIARNLTSFGGWEFCANLSSSIVMGADVILLNRFGTATDVVCFHLGSLPMRQLQNTLPALLVGAISPQLIALWVKGDRARIGRAYIRMGKYALWLSLFPVTFLTVLSTEILTVYAGPDFAAASPVMVLTLLLFPIAYGNILASSIIRAAGQPRTWAIASLSMHVFNLVITTAMVVVLEWGALGCALGSALSFALFYPLVVWPLGRSFAQVSLMAWVRQTLVPGVIPAAGVIVMLWVSKSGKSLDSWLEIISSCALGAILYVALIVCVTDKVDRKYVRVSLSKVRDTVFRYRTRVLHRGNCVN